MHVDLQTMQALKTTSLHTVISSANLRGKLAISIVFRINFAVSQLLVLNNCLLKQVIIYCRLFKSRIKC